MTSSAAASLSAFDSLVIRPATGADVPRLVELHSRCSADGLRYRYLSASPPHANTLRTLLRRTHTLVADCDGELVAMGNLHVAGTIAELALLVEETWQGFGLGPRLGALLTDHAVNLGARELVAVTAGSNQRVHGLMAKLGLRMSITYLDGIGYVRCPLPPDRVSCADLTPLSARG